MQLGKKRLLGERHIETAASIQFDPRRGIIDIAARSGGGHEETADRELVPTGLKNIILEGHRGGSFLRLDLAVRDRTDAGQRLVIQGDGHGRNIGQQQGRCAEHELELRPRQVADVFGKTEDELARGQHAFHAG